MENISDSKLLPYGMMNFAVIRRDDYYYVDKTAFIPLIERSIVSSFLCVLVALARA